MKKLIIHYDSNLSAALERVSFVVSKGRISKACGFKQFCFVTLFPIGKVIAKHKHREGCDTFEVRNVKQQNVKRSEK